ncbi:hypothetical protein ILUMI_02780 [Ignelater luminosus]|uniref:Tc1-like transposase DDE domain-containing protein n=1 Tax=Ignelater luminosus TaxID=2038154 RepID=A0A8K0GIY8_IGNLU|nr:hypothetical protein ILUMI_02780 [Ignelater luminosus]
MMWGCFVCDKVGKLGVLEGKVNAKKYIEVKERCLLPTIEMMFAPNKEFIYQQDHAPCHTAKCLRDYFLPNDIFELEWPGNSPDLNPIEHVWAKMKIKIREEMPENKKELKSELLQELVDSIPERIAAVVSAKGDHIVY